MRTRNDLNSEKTYLGNKAIDRGENRETIGLETLAIDILLDIRDILIRQFLPNTELICSKCQSSNVRSEEKYFICHDCGHNIYSG